MHEVVARAWHAERGKQESASEGGGLASPCEPCLYALARRLLKDGRRRVACWRGVAWGWLQLVHSRLQLVRCKRDAPMEVSRGAAHTVPAPPCTALAAAAAAIAVTTEAC